jgi:hypothetical protein
MGCPHFEQGTVSKGARLFAIKLFPPQPSHGTIFNVLVVLFSAIVTVAI